jgi:glycolate oxidase iron-sulfur subunit
MQTALADFLSDTAAGREAQQILRSCVHCGFCLPACPTYQLLGDELDSPRGRIYLIKQLLEGAPVGEATRLHLDRCLTCRACESACPSGVRYGRLIDIGRALSERQLPRPPGSALKRYLLRKVLAHRSRVRLLLGAARSTRWLLPRALRSQLPPPAPAPAVLHWPAPRHPRRVLLLPGCVQPALAPAIDAAAARVLDRLGISALPATATGCCGALAHHLGATADTHAQLRRNVDALWGAVEAGAEAIIQTSSACAAMLGEYARLLADDARYAERAARLSAVARDLSEVLSGEGPALAAAMRAAPMPAEPRRVAFQAPCSLQHALRADTRVADLLRAAGYELTAVRDGQRCCGAAGTYALLQPQLSQRLLSAKLDALAAGAPELIATANIGCLQHLRSDTSLPVRHYVELLDARLAGV